MFLYSCPWSPYVKTMFYRQYSILPIHSSHYPSQTSVSHCEGPLASVSGDSTRLITAGSAAGRSSCSVDVGSPPLWVPVLGNGSRWPENAHTHTHTGEELALRLLLSAVVKGECMFPGQRMAPMPFLCVTPGKVLNLAVGF